jgi:hypothetical protein
VVAFKEFRVALQQLGIVGSHANGRGERLAGRGGIAGFFKVVSPVQGLTGGQRNREEKENSS